MSSNPATYRGLYRLLWILALLSPVWLKGQSLSLPALKFTDEEEKAVPDLPLAIHYLNEQNQIIYSFFEYTDDKGLVKLPQTGKITFVSGSMVYKLSNDTLIISTAKTIPVQVKKINHHLPDVVITGEPNQTSLDKTVNKIKIISQERIQAQGAQTLQQVLGQEMNIRLQNDNLLGSSLSLQGLGGQNVKILIDGVPIIGRQNGNIDLSQINLASIERIEIIEGPMSVMYGTDATGGVINLITKKGSRDKVTFSPSAFYESSGTYNVRGTLSAAGKKVDGSVTGGRNFFDGIASQQPRVMSWKPREQYFADGNIGYKNSWTTQRLQVNYLDELMLNRGIPVQTPLEVYAFDDYFYTNRLQTSLNSGFNWKNNSIVVLNSISNYNRIKQTKRRNLNTLEDLEVPGIQGGDTQTFNQYMSRGFYGTSFLDKTVQVLGGYEVTKEEVKGGRIRDNYQEQQDIAAFGSVDYRPLQQLSVKPGFRYTSNSKFGSLLTPAFNTRYILGRHTFRFSYARGFRAPSLKELYIYFVDLNHNINPNENLNAETSHSFNASASGNFNVEKYRFNYDLNTYYNHVNNLINLAMTDAATQTYQYVNVDKVQTFGVNGTVKHNTERVQLSLGAGFIGTRQYNFGRFLGTTISPEVNAAANYIYLPFKTSVNLFAKYNGKVNTYVLDETGELQSFKTDHYLMMDASVSQPLMKRTLVVTVGSRNLFDVTTIGVTAGSAHSSGGAMNIGMGRTFFAELKYTIGIKK